MLRVVLVSLSVFFAASAHALIWGKDVGGICEPPGVYYGPLHMPGQVPCCATQPGVCAGGVACPGTGRCPDTGIRCTPGAPKSRPNVILFISDDQGDCHYGTAGECRSVQTGTPDSRRPSTPNLDVLAGYGTVFPIAHNTASWCFPSLNSMLTGRYQRSMDGSRNLADDFLTIPKRAARRSAAEAAHGPDPSTPAAASAATAPCSAGKFTGSRRQDRLRRPGATGERRLGRIACARGAGGSPPLCGTEPARRYDPSRPRFNMRDLFEFMDAMFYPGAGQSPGAFTHAALLHLVRAAHPARAAARRPTRSRAISSAADPPASAASSSSARCAAGSSCPAAVPAFNESNFGTEREFYANVWWVDDNVREIRKYLARKSAPHCILTRRPEPLRATTPAQCAGGTLGDRRSRRRSSATRSSSTSPTTAGSCPTRSTPSPRTATARGSSCTTRARSADRALAAPPAPRRRRRTRARSWRTRPTCCRPSSARARHARRAELSRERSDGTRVRRPRPASLPARTRRRRRRSQPLRHSLCGTSHASAHGADPPALPPDAPGYRRPLRRRQPVRVHVHGQCGAGEICLGGRCTPNAAGQAAPIRRVPRRLALPRGPLRRRPPMYRRLVLRLRPGTAVGPLRPAHGPLVSQRAQPDLHHGRRLSRRAPAGDSACGRLCETQQLKLYLTRSRRIPAWSTCSPIPTRPSATSRTSRPTRCPRRPALRRRRPAAQLLHRRLVARGLSAGTHVRARGFLPGRLRLQPVGARRYQPRRSTGQSRAPARRPRRAAARGTRRWDRRAPATRGCARRRARGSLGDERDVLVGAEEHRGAVDRRVAVVHAERLQAAVGHGVARATPRSRSRARESAWRKGRPSLA